MATLPPWLTNFETPTAVLSAASAAAARRAATEQAQQEIALRNRIAQEETARQSLLANIQLEGQRAQQDIRQQALNAELQSQEQQMAIEAAKEARRAQESALMMQGVQDFQNDIASGLSYRDALIRNLGKLAIGDPSLLTQVKPEFVPGKVMDIGSSRFQGVLTSPTQMQVVSKDEFVSPLDQAKLDKLKAEISNLQSRIPQTVRDEANSIAQGIMGDDLTELDERIAKVREVYQKLSVPQNVPRGTKTIHVELPDGRTGYVPEENLDKLPEGTKVIP